ncbi:3-isopropylmalate dehydratase small subunit 1 [bioreactor metagenome]|uniref:3-isopropylmalate dehydratase n=1 Tax=bioreactor metagenome TaxID=1076179 RepID=A0A644Z7A7_9ZZZZ
MEPFTFLDGIVVPLNRANVDTDAIIPKQFMKSIRRTGFGGNLFDEWRYLDKGEPGQDCAARPTNPAFVLNQPRYQGSSILLARANFGCGSSREHAPWALHDYGIRALIAPSFADIFYGNCLKNGMLPIVLPEVEVQYLFEQVKSQPGYRLRINLERQSIEAPIGPALGFEFDPFRKRCLLNGIDDISLTLEHDAEIRRYEARRNTVQIVFLKP